MQLSDIKGIGSLTVLEIYDWYDGPRLFSAETKAGLKMLVIWVEHCKTHDRWFYVPVSTERLKEVRSGRRPLRTAILEPEDRWVWEVETYFDQPKAHARPVSAEHIGPDDLPDHDARVSCDGPLISRKHQLVQKGHEVLDLVLDLPSKDTAVDNDVLGDILKRLQSLVRFLGVGPIEKWGRIPRIAANQYTLKVLSTFESSFGVRMIMKNPTGIQAREDVVMTLNRLFRVLSSAIDGQEVTGIRQEIGHRAFTQLTGIFSCFSDLRAGVELRWVSTQGDIRSCSLDQTRVVAVADTLSKRESRPIRNEQIPIIETYEELQPHGGHAQPLLPPKTPDTNIEPKHTPLEFTVEGVFRLIDAINHRFVFLGQPDQRRYSGVIVSWLNEEQLTINQAVRVTLRGSQGTEQTEHELLHVSPL